MTAKISSLLFVAFVGTLLLAVNANFAQYHGALKVNGNKVVNQAGQEMVLRGMSLFWSQWMGQFWNADVVRNLKETWNINLIRAAMAVEEGGYLSNPDAEKAKLITIIEAAIANGIYVIVDWHDHNANQHVAQAQGFFAEIAQRYANVPNIIYETWNEPLDWHSWDSVIKPYHEQVVGTIRQHTQNLIVCGTRVWSQRVDEASNNPIYAPNIAYTLHFYSSSHRQEVRDIAQAALNKGAAIFVTEFGLSEASGAGNLDEGEWYAWLQFMDNNKISWANWAIDDKPETSAALNPGASTTGPWGNEQISRSGLLVKSAIQARQQ